MSLIAGLKSILLACFRRFWLDEEKVGRYSSGAMPTFLWTGKTASGQEEVDRITADTPEAARKILEERGWTDLRQHTTEIHDFVKSQGNAASDPEYRPKLTPKEDLAFMKGTAPGVWTNWLKSLWESAYSILIFGAGLAWGIYRHNLPAMLIFGALLVLIVFLFPALHIWFSQTKNAFQKLHSARNWRRWDEVLQCLDKLQSAQSATKIGIGAAEIARYRALALAGLGRLDEAVKLFEEAADTAKMPAWLFHVHLATVYSTAKEYERGLEMYRLALDEATDKSIVLIDMSGFLVERFNRPDEAKQLLAQAEGLQLSELARNFLPKVRGLIAYREKDFAAMDRHFREALANNQKQPPNKYYIFEPAILSCKGYLAVSCAALGKKDEARAYFAEGGKYLSTICLDEPVAEYHALIKA